jgi:hypothetical protein
MSELIFALLGALLASASAVLSIVKTRHKQQAERKLRYAFKQYRESLKLLEAQNHEELLKDPPDPKSLEKLRALFDNVLDSLDESSRKEIREALDQPSLIGQRDYMLKLVT